MKKKQNIILKHHNRFEKIYNSAFSKSDYSKPINFAIRELNLNENKDFLKLLPIMGVFPEILKNTENVTGINLPKGIFENGSNPLELINVINRDTHWINNDLKFDIIFCNLCLSRFSEWKKTVDNLISVLKPNGKIVIVDWCIEKVGLRRMFIKWIGKGEVNRPIWQYLENKVANFKMDNSFENGKMFVASGNKR